MHTTLAVLSHWGYSQNPLIWTLRVFEGPRINVVSIINRLNLEKIASVRNVGFY